jgi:hypothetical protein
MHHRARPTAGIRGGVAVIDRDDLHMSGRAIYVQGRLQADVRVFPPHALRLPPATLGLAADGLKSNCSWGQMSDKLHGLTVFVQLRITTELRLDCNRPRQTLWSSSFDHEALSFKRARFGNNETAQTASRIL